MRRCQIISWLQGLKLCHFDFEFLNPKSDFGAENGRVARRLGQALQRVDPGRLAETLVRAATAEAAARHRLQRDLVSLMIPSLFLLPLILPLPFPLIICTGKGSVIIQYIGYGLAGHLILGPEM